MKICFRKIDGKTQTGREKFEFYCSECNENSWYDFHWFYDPRLGFKEINETSASRFVQAINNHSLNELTDNKKLRWQIYNAVCGCTEESQKVIDPEDQLRILSAKKIIDPTIKIPEGLIRMVKLKQPKKICEFWNELESLGAEVRELIYEGNGVFGFKIYTKIGGYLDYGTKEEIFELVKRDNGEIPPPPPIK